MRWWIFDDVLRDRKMPSWSSAWIAPGWGNESLYNHQSIYALACVMEAIVADTRRSRSMGLASTILAVNFSNYRLAYEFLLP